MHFFEISEYLDLTTGHNRAICFRFCWNPRFITSIIMVGFIKSEISHLKNILHFFEDWKTVGFIHMLCFSNLLSKWPQMASHQNITCTMVLKLTTVQIYKCISFPSYLDSCVLALCLSLLRRAASKCTFILKWCLRMIILRLLSNPATQYGNYG